MMNIFFYNTNIKAPEYLFLTWQKKKRGTFFATVFSRESELIIFSWKQINFDIN